jgi:hypothetical protein
VAGASPATESVAEDPHRLARLSDRRARQSGTRDGACAPSERARVRRTLSPAASNSSFALKRPIGFHRSHEQPRPPFVLSNCRSRHIRPRGCGQGCSSRPPEHSLVDCRRLRPAARLLRHEGSLDSSSRSTRARRCALHALLHHRAGLFGEPLSVHDRHVSDHHRRAHHRALRDGTPAAGVRVRLVSRGAISRQSARATGRVRLSWRREN